VNRGDHGAGAPEWTPEGVYDVCHSRSRTWSRIFECKPARSKSENFNFCRSQIIDFIKFKLSLNGQLLYYRSVLLDKLVSR